jgi:hypothetical protein
VWGIVPKAAWHWGGDNNVTNNPFGAPGCCPSYVCLPPTWGSAGCCGTNMYRKKLTGRNGKDCNWIQMLLLWQTFLWNQATMKSCCYVRYCSLSDVRDYWRNKTVGDAQYIIKRSHCIGSLVRPTRSHSYWFFSSLFIAFLILCASVPCIILYCW